MFKFDLNAETAKRAIRNPSQVVDEIFLQHGYRIPSTLINNYVGIGTNVFSREWDLLIILDSCRIDALEEVADEYDFLDEIGSLRSVGGSTPEWISNTFSPRYRKEINKTTYLSATGQIRAILDERLPSERSLSESHLAYKLLKYADPVHIDELESFEPLFKYEPKGQEGPLGHPKGSTPPRYVTERAIARGRADSPERLLVHYMQPHVPYVSNAIREDRDLYPHEERALRYLRDTGEFETVWNSYLDEIRYVLDDVEILLNNFDADRAVISADHGDAFGEYGIYGHTVGSLHPKVRNVPWATTSARDSGTYSPSIRDPDEAPESVEESTEEFLEALGYKF